MLNSLFAGVALALISASLPSMAAEIQTFPELFGTWTVQRMVGATEVTANQQSAGKPLGTKIMISANSISTYEGSAGICRPRDATVTVVNTNAELEKDWGTKITGFYLPRGAVKPRLPMMDAGCAAALVIDRDTLLWAMANGYIYTVKRDPPGQD